MEVTDVLLSLKLNPTLRPSFEVVALSLVEFVRFEQKRSAEVLFLYRRNLSPHLNLTGGTPTRSTEYS